MRWRRRATLLAAGLAGSLVGALVAFTVADLRDDGSGVPDSSAAAVGTDRLVPDQRHQHPDRPAATALAPTTAVDHDSPPEILLVWTSGGLPHGLSATAVEHQLAEHHTMVRGAQVDLVRSIAADGSVVDAPPDGWAIPLDTIAIDPDSFASFVDADALAGLAALEPGTALLTQSSARLRRLGPGSSIELRTGQVRIVGVIDDLAGGGAELVLHADDAERLGAGIERYLLLGHRPGDRESLSKALAEAASPAPVRFRSPAETTWLRHGDAVTPPVFVKLAFGEFAYRGRTGRDIEIDPAWVAEQIVVAEVPLLGSVRCHVSMIEPLRSVLTELEQTNLGHLVDPAGYAGCWAPRRISAGQPLSRHAWGVAVDLNIGDNPRGSFSTQDPRLVDLMRSAGFVWGGSWLVPDPGHYELDPP